MKTREERRILSSCWRALASTGDEQFRALDRVQALAGELLAFNVWLKTIPDPALVKKALGIQRMRLLQHIYIMPTYEMPPLLVSANRLPDIRLSLIDRLKKNALEVKK